MTFHDLLADLPPGASAQAAGVTLGYTLTPPRAVGARSGAARLRCASLLKPLYAWAAHAHLEEGRWRRAAASAIRVSSNPATLELWFSAGPRTILAWLNERAGVAWTRSSADPEWFGGVEVTAEEVVAAYGTLALAGVGGDPVAGAILS